MDLFYCFSSCRRNFTNIPCYLLYCLSSLFRGYCFLAYNAFTNTEFFLLRTVRVAKEYYKKSAVLNLFGLIGSSVLLGLYIYSVVLPRPLSPINRPEAVDVAGILDKSLEVVLIIGIVYLIWMEKK